jgi:hypothetical protein
VVIAGGMSMNGDGERSGIGTIAIMTAIIVRLRMLASTVVERRGRVFRTPPGNGAG